MFLAFGVVPHQWIAHSDADLQWTKSYIIYGPFDMLKPQALGGNFPFTISYEAVRDTVVVLLHVWYFGAHPLPLERVAEARRRQAQHRGRHQHVRSSIGQEGLARMARTDANPPMMPYTDEYQLVEVDADYLSKAVKPKQFIHIDQTECIMCEGCVDICPWKCIHMVTPDAIVEATGTELPGEDPSDNVLFIIDDDICTRCALCVDRCPTGVIILGRAGAPDKSGDSHVRTNNHGYAYGMRL